MAQAPPLLSVTSLTPAFHLAQPPNGSDGGDEAASKPWAGLEFDMHEGDVLIVRGPSGCGKTTLLKCLADLVVYEGQVRFLGHLPTSSTISPAVYRSRVQYVPQRPPLYSGTPLELLSYVQSFEANKLPEPIAPIAVDAASIDEEASLVGSVSASPHTFGWAISEPMEGQNNSKMATPGVASTVKGPVAAQPSTRSLEYRLPASAREDAPPIGPDPVFFSSAYWNVPSRVWRTEWATLSGGEVQRCSLAIALALKVGQKSQGVLLLDEPTSALDADTCEAIEQTLLTGFSPPLTLIWITHNDEQMERVTKLVREDNARRAERESCAGQADAGRVNAAQRKVRVLKLGQR